ncbi:dihydroxyacetone kinase subunit L [[Clostridium] hylemonae]|uniref:dihydroxyacetone kinase subunit L n=1 Tax=[Clostridium] hylemonae TaxID=89153 RepID=UPI001FCBF077|nr:dihydroxyacetone kinase subunit L [[Clostridium] hylemonae]BDF02961.1 DAK2 domain-containing protein [[Clostridium] hylemonae]
MQKESLNKAVDFISRKMDEKCLYLVELDQQNGDGDLGISMKEGFAAARHFLSNTDEKDLGRLMMGMSGTFNEAAPSSLGTILSIGMMGMAKALKGKEEVSVKETADAFRSGLEKIMEKAGSMPGEKTILDALYPASEALKEHASEELAKAYESAAEAAKKGAESTRMMLSRHGRAAYYGEKSLGILDGGAAAGQLIFEAIKESVCSNSY